VRRLRRQHHQRHLRPGSFLIDILASSAARPSRLARALLVVLVCSQGMLLSGCLSDSARSQHQHQRAVEESARGMRRSMQQTPRGVDLAGDALRAALAGKTMVGRYDGFPGGAPGKYVTFRHYRADGVLVFVNNQFEREPTEGDVWKIDGAQLCQRQQFYSQDWLCYRVARAGDGSLQFYIDDPGAATDTLLTEVAREIIDGPPPVGSVTP
jgi:hypothetical protein